jgi:hypothetical protein
MNLRVAANAAMLFVTTALIVYGLSGWLNATFALTNTPLGALLGDAWKLVAIALALAILAGYAWPKVRGVRRGDVLVTMARRQHATPMGLLTVNEPVFATALENARVGAKIRVQLQNGSLAEGVVESYAGTLTPPSIRLTETETLNAAEGEVRFNAPRDGKKSRGRQNDYGEKQ